MRVTFITGSLEPGKDGVGDYTRWLAVESTSQNASCRLLALADRHIDDPIRGGDESGLDRLRLPFRMPWSERLRLAREFMAAAPADWVSLQFVPYSFQRWGVAAKLVRALPDLVGDTPLHVMLHEVWIDGGTSPQRRLVSAAQRRAVLGLAKYPGAVVHTSNGTYQQALAQHGVRAGRLPLFGSVPVADCDAAAWLRPLLEAEGCDALSGGAGRRGAWWLFTLFGTLHPVWPPEPLIDRLQSAAAAAGKRVALVAAGRLGAGEPIWSEMRSRYGAGLPMVQLGEQPAARISELFNTVDFGIATTPFALIGKSATVAAMLDHGLPVVVNRDDCRWPAPATSDEREQALLIRMGADLPVRLRQTPRLPPSWRLPRIAARWLGELASAAETVPTWSS